MSEVQVQSDQNADDQAAASQPAAKPIESRFLYVDVAALRAKQLRRGAKSRLEPAEEETLPVTTASTAASPAGPPAPGKLKAERVAMQEVRQGLIEWDLPDFKAVFDTR